MSQDVTQWLAEIRDLKQQLETLTTEREEAYASAAKWRKLYETEAQQRRQDIQKAKRTITSLETETQRLQQGGIAQTTDGNERDAIAQAVQTELQSVKTPAELRSRIEALMTEKQRLAKALEQEKAQHVQTRKSLTAALGDAIDQFTKAQTAKPETQATQPQPASDSVSVPDLSPAPVNAAKTAALELDLSLLNTVLPNPLQANGQMDLAPEPEET